MTRKTKFSFQPTLEGQNINLRPLAESDFDGLFACASDKKIWEGHPSTDRYKLSEFTPYFKDSIESKACLVAVDKQSQKIIGLSRYYQVENYPQDICIGFTFLARAYWGGATNLEMKTLMLNHSLQSFSTTWFHVGLSNIRSQKAMEKIGGEYIGEDDFIIGGKSGRWMYYRITKDAWVKNT